MDLTCCRPVPRRSSASMTAAEFLRFARDATLASGQLDQGDLLDIFDEKSRALELPDMASLRRSHDSSAMMPPTGAEADATRRHLAEDNSPRSGGAMSCRTTHLQQTVGPAGDKKPAATERPGSAASEGVRGSSANSHGSRPFHLETNILEHTAGTAPAPNKVATSPCSRLTGCEAQCRVTQRLVADQAV